MFNLGQPIKLAKILITQEPLGLQEYYYHFSTCSFSDNRLQNAYLICQKDVGNFEEVHKAW